MARSVRILMVEDNPGDVRLMHEALREGKIESVLDVARDGEEALAVLRREGSHSAASRPDLILLDLNLPRKDGRELLAEIKKDESLRSIPVLVLTTSNAAPDVARAYDLHANCYIIKPMGLQQFFDVANSIERFWLTVATLPPGD